MKKKVAFKAKIRRKLNHKKSIGLNKNFDINSH